MQTNQTKKIKRDLSHINNYTDLQKEIRALKRKISTDEKELAGRLKQVPLEGLKAAATTVLPVFLASKVTTKGFGLVTSLLGLLIRKNKGAATKSVVQNAKGLGLFAGLQALTNIWKKKTEKTES